MATPSDSPLANQASELIAPPMRPPDNIHPINSDAEKSRPPIVLSRDSTVLAAANRTELTQLSVKCMRQTVVKSSVKSTPTQFWAAQPAPSLDAQRTTRWANEGPCCLVKAGMAAGQIDGRQTGFPVDCTSLSPV